MVSVLPGALATDLGHEGFVIASGLARGIDTAAHLAALPRGTIAVLAGGIDNVYPPENEELHRSRAGTSRQRASTRLLAARQGLPPPQSPDLGDLAWRLVVEGAGRSGSLITVLLAGEQGREVFAVPGSPLDTRSAGTNNLMKHGACLVTSARDIVETLAPILGRPLQPAAAVLVSADEERTAERSPTSPPASEN